MEPINSLSQLPVETQKPLAKSNSQLAELEGKISSFNPSILLIPRSDIELGKELGKGGFGTVYEGTWAFRKVAVKRFEGSRLPERISQEVRQEISIMLKLDHECLIRLFGIQEEENLPPMLVMEYGANGSLYTFLHSNQEISWLHRLQLAEELARGLAYLHSLSIIHRDIKSLNVVLDKDFHAKWCDFGLAQLKQHSTTTSKADASGGGGLAGTLPWMAPELFSRKSSTPSMQSDIWALGMVFFELASRGIPYKDAQTPHQVMNWIMNGEGEEIPAECLEQAPDFGALMQQCWMALNKRPTAAYIAAEVDIIFKRMGGKKNTAAPNSTTTDQLSLLSSGYAQFSVGQPQVPEIERQAILARQLPQSPVAVSKLKNHEEENLPTFIDYTYKDPGTGFSNTKRIEFNRDSGEISSIKTKNTWLHIASMIEHTTMLKAFIAFDPKINLEQRNEEGMTPLMLAIQEVKEKSIEILLDAGADIYALSPSLGSCLHLAARAGLRIIDIVLEKKGISLNLDVEDSEGLTPLIAAIRAPQMNLAERTDVAIRLIDCGADINKSSKDGWTSPLSAAIGQNNVQVFNYLLQRGAKLSHYKIIFGNKQELTGLAPLPFALSLGASKEIIDGLIAAGDNPHLILDCEDADYAGTNLVYWATYGGKPEVLEYFLKDLGLDPNKQSQSKTNFPLDIATRRNPDILKLLLKYGADPNKKNSKGISPLANYLNYEKYKLLLNAGADPNGKTDDKDYPTCFFLFIQRATQYYDREKYGDLNGDLKRNFQELTELFFIKGGKVNLKMEKKLRSNAFYAKDQEKFLKLIDDHTKVCTIM